MQLYCNAHLIYVGSVDKSIATSVVLHFSHVRHD